MLRKALSIIVILHALLPSSLHAQHLATVSPEITAYEEELTTQIQQWLAKHTAANDTAEYTIPTVVHIIHDYQPLYGGYMPDDNIYEAVKDWNNAFNASSPDTADVILPFKKYIGNAHIQLRLATIDPDGNPTKGVTRHFSALTQSAGDQSKLDQWPPDKYLNIWLITNLGAPNDDAASYAYRPSFAVSIPYYDGIMLFANYLDANNTIPHAAGHYLDLKHPWGGEGEVPANICGDDGIDDTPPTTGHPATGCAQFALYDTTCATGYLKHYMDAQNMDSVADYPDTANAQNIMDATFCAKMFTKGQCEHMRASLNSNIAGRNNLISAANLAATGALNSMPDLLPVPAFSVEKGRQISGMPPAERTYFYCANEPAIKFSFLNRSWNDTVTSLHWHFSNNAIPTDTTVVPSNYAITNTFAQPGWVTISLTATGNNSGSATLTDSQAVYAADGSNPIVENPAAGPMHFMEFNPGQTDNWPIFNYYKNSFKWQLNNGVGYYDNTSIEYLGFDTRQFPANETGSPKGDYDDFFSVAYDLSAMVNNYCNINFMSAGAYRTDTTANAQTNTHDTLDVSYSIDCGRTWVSLHKYEGAELDNNGLLPIAYAPLWIGEWKLNSIELPVAARTTKTFFRFRYKPGANADGFSTGNNFYLDRISISNFPTGVSSLLNEDNDVVLAPNPTSDDSYVLVNSKKQEMVTVRVTDISGRIIYLAEQDLPANVNRLNIPSQNFSTGLYFVTISRSNQSITKKLLVCEK